jgi:hypothetical protein
LLGNLAVKTTISHVNLLNLLDQLIVRVSVFIPQHRPESLRNHEEALDVHLHQFNF